MRSKATARLLAQTDVTCEFLLDFFKKSSKDRINCDKIQRHIEIEKEILDSKINLLREAGLISNHKVYDENKEMVDRLFSLTKDGETALIELGHDFN